MHTVNYLLQKHRVKNQHINWLAFGVSSLVMKIKWSISGVTRMVIEEHLKFKHYSFLIIPVVHFWKIKGSCSVHDKISLWWPFHFGGILSLLIGQPIMKCDLTSWNPVLWLNGVTIGKCYIKLKQKGSIIFIPWFNTVLPVTILTLYDFEITPMNDD